MADIPEPATTQRAYTLRLHGIGGDKTWREALWAAHEAVNRGAKAFGDWLLTLRGGLDHTLAEPPPPAKGKKATAAETGALRKNRRILLALSWLSVEDERGAPNGPVRVATGKDTDSVRKEKVLAALRSILAGRKVGKQEVELWVADCADSLGAKIREDAAWIDRSGIFDRRAQELRGLTRGYATATIMAFFGPAEEYFQLPDTDSEATGSASASDGPEFRTLARQWASTNFGTGEKSDTAQIIKALSKIAAADLDGFAGRPSGELLARIARMVGGAGSEDPADQIRAAVGWKGRPSKGRLALDGLPERLTKTAIANLQTKCAEEAEDKESKAGLREVPTWMPKLRAAIESACGMPFVGERNHIGEFSVMLDHAARRVSIGHSWIKRAEAERRRFEEDARRLSDVPPAAAAWLGSFVGERSGTSGAAAAGGKYRIRRRAIEGWNEIVKRWKRVACKTSDDRIAAARDLQSDPEVDKFGDIQLFEALADDDAECVWRIDGKAESSILKDYVYGHDARDKQRRFKVPAYRHPDPLSHPAFGDFGNSRWEIQYAALEAAKGTRGDRRIGKDDAQWIKNPRSMRMGLWDGARVRDVDLGWASKRLSKDLGLGPSDPDSPVRDVTRADRLGRAASGLRPGEVPSAAGLFALDDWNGRLQAPRAQLDALATHVTKHGWDAEAKKLRHRLRWLVSFSAKLECRGPFIRYAAANGIEPNRKGEYFPNSERNKAREGHAKLVLSRLPSLRVLSVDLGHRFAAACAVWETLSSGALKAEIAGRAKAAGGTGRNDLYLHTCHSDGRGKERTTIYRRVATDKLSDGTDHPASWARLDRQFLIKLQGEDQAARMASPGELDAVRQLEADVGRVRDPQSLMPNPIGVQIAENAGVKVSFTGWLIASSVPTLAAILLLPVIVFKLFPPGVRSTPEAPGTARKDLAAMGPMSRNEWITAVTFVAMVAGWVFGNALGLNSTAVAFLGFGVLLVTGVLTIDEICKQGDTLVTFLWLAVLFAMSAQLNELGFMGYLGDRLASHLGGLSVPALYVTLIALYVALHYFFVSQTSQVLALLAVFLDVGVRGGVHAPLMAYGLLFASSYFSAITPQGGSQNIIFAASGYLKQSELYKLGLLTTLAFMVVYLVIGTPWLLLITR